MKSFIKFFLFLLLTAYVLNAKAAVGATCTTDAEGGCTDTNAECTGEDNAKTCTCKTNYEAEGTKCVVSLGKTCAATDTCVANAECTGTDAKTCTCKTNYTAKDNKCESNTGTNTNNTNTNNDTSGSSFLKVFIISFLSLLF